MTPWARIGFGILASAPFWTATTVLSTKIDGHIRSTQRDLKKVRAKLSQKEEERQEAAQKAKELADEVGRISRELQSSRQSLKEVQSRLRETEKKRASMEERLWVSRLGIDQWGDLLSQELQRYYVRRLMSGESQFMDLVYRQAAMQDKITGLRFALQHHAQVEGLRNELVEVQGELQKLRTKKQREEERVEGAQAQLRALYQTVRGRRAVIEREIQDLNTTAHRFEKMIQDLIRRREEEEAREAAARRTEKAPVAARTKRRHLPWPIEGTVIERFGRSRHPELDTYVFSNGIKLRPAPSAPVRSVEKGEILFAEEFMSYGLMALVHHPGNIYSIYAHLGSLKVARGQKVAMGEVIGTPGQDDSGRSLVYFELRVDGAPIDPLTWLQ